MELSFNNKEKMNDSGSTFLPNISHVNSAEAFRTSNVNQSTSDEVVEEEKIHELLDKIIPSTRIEGDNNGTRPSAGGYALLRQLLDCVDSTSSDNDKRTNSVLTTDLNLTLE
ncbi:unnamed protein product [Rotaria magnacalcarata]|uniref:Uncharacterized protein n=1 Tax=Rotaria magnacalcarata TaxID=392030 RepID=A0A816QUG7_9BILA|nr:unnamed protein product [Rotaria magnacalcarata]